METAAQEELRAAGARPRRQADRASTLDSRRAASRGPRRAWAHQPGDRRGAVRDEDPVDWHLRNAYLKLDVHRREELVALLAGEDESHP